VWCSIAHQLKDFKHELSHSIKNVRTLHLKTKRGSFKRKIPFGSSNALSFEHLLEWITKWMEAYLKPGLSK